MELKNALAIALISFFSASLVVLIARSLDVQAASRIEPQLERIAEQMELLRQQGIRPASQETAESPNVADGLIVYYFHGNTRCPTCRAIESQTYATLHADFREQLEQGTVVWQLANYESPSPAATAWRTKFEVQVAVVVLARMEGGEVQQWKRLDQVWALYDDPPAFADFIRAEVTAMLNPPNAATADEAEAASPDIPLPDAS